MFIPATLKEGECVEGQAKGRSRVEDILDHQAFFKREVTNLMVILSDKEIEIVQLKAKL